MLAAIAARRDLPSPNCVVHTSPNRLHVLWRVTGFGKEAVEALQKKLAGELGTDRAATSCAQMTRLPGYVNHKYRPGLAVTAAWAGAAGPSQVEHFKHALLLGQVTGMACADPESAALTVGDVCERAKRYIAVIPTAVSGNHGDLATFRVCCRLVRGFNLTDEQALAVLSDWNRACSPPWPETELRLKLAAARAYGREPVGGLLGPPIGVVR